jgi:molybdopterin-guanine dinucleotide biosynthesis protein A
VKGVILAGGASARFGGTPKGLLPLHGRAMALRVADVLLRVCTSVVIEAPHGTGYEVLGLPLIYARPEYAGKGPLAALATGLAAEDQGYVAFAPCDMPLLTREIYAALIQVGGKGTYARTVLGVEPLVAILSANLRDVLLTALAAEVLPRTHAVLDAAGARAVDFPDPAPFANVNTPADLARMESTLRAHRQ